MVLVKDVEFHWALHNAGKGHKEWSVGNCVQNIEHMAAVLLLGEWGIGVPLGSKNIVVLRIIIALY